MSNPEIIEIKSVCVSEKSLGMSVDNDGLHEDFSLLVNIVAVRKTTPKYISVIVFMDGHGQTLTTSDTK